MVESLPKVFMQRTFLPFLGVWQMAMMNKEVNCEKFSCHVKSIVISVKNRIRYATKTDTIVFSRLLSLGRKERVVDTSFSKRFDSH
jgi:hypothetical protein